MNVLSFNYNRFVIRLIISFFLSAPSYSVFALIRNLPFDQMQLYSFFEYGAGVFVGLAILFELHNLKSIWLEEKMPWNKKFYFRLAIEIFLTIILTLIITTGGYYTFYKLVWNMGIIFPSVVLYNTIGVFLSLLFMVFVNVQYLLNNWKKAALRAESLEKENIRAKLEALQNQISPHFLFNNFNILNALIDEDISLAKKYLSKLSDVFRYILQHKHIEVVGLNEELQFVKDYAFLIKTRFGNNFILSLDVSDKFNGKKIPPVSIQLLVENAIKHNEISERNSLEVKIKELDDTIVVSNNIKLKKKRNIDGTNTGLTNILERYSFLTDEKVIIQNNDLEYKVVLPLLEIHDNGIIK